MMTKLTRPQIRAVFLRNGARIEPDRDDLPDWIYEAAFELLAAAPAVQGESLPVGYIRRSSIELMKNDELGVRANIIKEPRYQDCVPLYLAPQPAEQPAEQQPAPNPLAEGYFHPLPQENDYEFHDAERFPEGNDCPVCIPALIVRKSELASMPEPDVAGLVQQHHRDSAELRRLCQARDEQRDGRIAALERAAKALELAVKAEADVAGLVEALEEIIHPVRFMQERLEEGERLNGMAAVQLAEDASYLRGIATAALAAHRSQGGEVSLCPSGS